MLDHPNSKRVPLFILQSLGVFVVCIIITPKLRGWKKFWDFVNNAGCADIKIHPRGEGEGV